LSESEITAWGGLALLKRMFGGLAFKERLAKLACNLMSVLRYAVMRQKFITPL
jgi:hypothetical protein